MATARAFRPALKRNSEAIACPASGRRPRHYQWTTGYAGDGFPDGAQGHRGAADREGRTAPLGLRRRVNPSLRNYHARIELEPTSDSGTVIHWYGEYETGWALRWILPHYLQKFMQGMAEGLARFAEEGKPTR
ncbi:hypothetical protein GCM10010289_01940 [Streptomyces violascens]|uniref:Polyketide cyclase n=2 Tax=Streptomyces violascens TaxID=67381 RepID=A0ABQ3QF46_9ACTN|nr:hypothetical protein GCM10010289_01940 [Streptomyces violascens]GHI35859.1 hypothetical protein Sviol_02670 [Streptomyces violascens]